MNNFNFCVPTDIRFGKGQIACLPEELKIREKNFNGLRWWKH